MVGLNTLEGSNPSLSAKNEVSKESEGFEEVVDTFLKENIIQPELNM